MKKIVLTTLFILLLIFYIGIISYSYIELDSAKKDNKIIKDKINGVEIDKVKEDNTNYNNEYNSLNENNKDKMEELDIWKKAKEKLEKAS